MKMKTRSAVALGAGVAILLGLTSVPVWAEAASAAQSSGPSLSGRLWRFSGVLHPMVVHFPIALLTVAALVELLRLKYRKEISQDVTLICLVVAAAAAVAAAVLGWARALTYGDSDLLFNHRWLGTGLTILTVILAALAIAARRKPASNGLRWTQTIGVFIAAGLVGLVGHLGGELTYGEGFVQNAWAAAINPPKPFKPVNPSDIAPIPAIAELPKPQTPQESGPPPTEQITFGGGVPETIAPPIAAAQPVDFLTQVWPIIHNHCVECHGPNKAKAKLRLDTETFAMQWSKNGRPLWVKGKSAESYLLKVIGPEADDDDRMPPLDSNKVVTPQEYELIRRWIDEGASWPTLPEAPGPAAVSSGPASGSAS